MPKNKKYGKGSMSAQNTVAVKNYGRHEGSTIGDQMKGISDLEDTDKVKSSNRKRRRTKVKHNSPYKAAY
jgi:hypothetical protein